MGAPLTLLRHHQDHHRHSNRWDVVSHCSTSFSVYAHATSALRRYSAFDALLPRDRAVVGTHLHHWNTVSVRSFFHSVRQHIYRFRANDLSLDVARMRGHHRAHLAFRAYPEHFAFHRTRVFSYARVRRRALNSRAYARIAHARCGRLRSFEHRRLCALNCHRVCRCWRGYIFYVTTRFAFFLPRSLHIGTPRTRFVCTRHVHSQHRCCCYRAPFACDTLYLGVPSFTARGRVHLLRCVTLSRCERRFFHLRSSRAHRTGAGLSCTRLPICASRSTQTLVSRRGRASCATGGTLPTSTFGQHTRQTLPICTRRIPLHAHMGEHHSLRLVASPNARTLGDTLPFHGVWFGVAGNLHQTPIFKSAGVPLPVSGTSHHVSAYCSLGITRWCQTRAAVCRIRSAAAGRYTALLRCSPALRLWYLGEHAFLSLQIAERRERIDIARFGDCTTAFASSARRWNAERFARCRTRLHTAHQIRGRRRRARAFIAASCRAPMRHLHAHCATTADVWRTTSFTFLAFAVITPLDVSRR